MKHQSDFSSRDSLYPAGTDLISEQWFVAEQQKLHSQNKVFLDEVDIEPLEPMEENYTESPADISGDSADDLVAELLMGLSFRPDDDDMPPSRRWTELELSAELM